GLHQRLPLLVVELGTLVVAGQPGGRGQDEDLRATRGQLSRRPRRHRDRVVDRRVQRRGEKAADQRQAELVQQRRRVVREVPRGTELGRRQSQLGHLTEDRLRVQHATPARYFAHAPRDGGSGQADRV